MLNFCIENNLAPTALVFGQALDSISHRAYVAKLTLWRMADES